MTTVVDKWIDVELAHFDITVDDRIDCDFNMWRVRLRGNRRGIYVISEPETDVVIYVGRGIIKTRQKMHEHKVLNTLPSYFSEPPAWKWLREVRGADMEKWHLTALYLSAKDDEAAMEGALIKRLQPLVNDETFKPEVV